ncbi:MAG: 2-oxoacid:acceptor oxidoreductase family protein [Candidatus Lokiarchaeota archaeon]|nr:2-oxoacid:acceptor oxidoreductase family protein [Candidatus Harpocratesius repetitus]
MKNRINIAIVGLGGQGVITLANLIAATYHSLEKQVCFNEIHGLSQRGGSVQSLLAVNDNDCPVFALEDTDYLIGMEKLETLRYLYTSKSHPIVIMGNRYEIRNTVYFDLEHFPEEKDIDAEIRKLVKKLYLFNSVDYEKKISFRIKPTNIAIFGALSEFTELGLDPKIAKKNVRKHFAKNPIAQSFNLTAFKEGKSWLKEMNL